jgi:phosphoglycolate phosphatase-like HAD superfamily hydrolase
MAPNRLYVFDIDGTLISTGGAGSSAMRAAFTALWRVEDGFSGVEFAGRTDRAILRDALVAGGFMNGSFPADLARFKRAYLRRLPATLTSTAGTVLPGVVPLLDRLRLDGGATLALGSGNFRRGALMKLRHYGIDHYFSVGGFGDDADDRSAMIARAIRAGRRRAGSRATVYVIGDTLHDIAAAKANGVVAVGVATGPVSEDILTKAGADIVLPTLEEAVPLLR